MPIFAKGIEDVWNGDVDSDLLDENNSQTQS